MSAHPYDRMNAYRERHRALGLCLQCSQRVAPEKSRCPKHVGSERRRSEKRNRALSERRRAARAAVTPRPLAMVAPRRPVAIESLSRRLSALAAVLRMALAHEAAHPWHAERAADRLRLASELAEVEGLAAIARLRGD